MTARKEGEPATGGRIPAFASIEEEAAFWDSHDTTDFENEFEPAEVTFAPELSADLTRGAAGTPGPAVQRLASA